MIEQYIKQRHENSVESLQTEQETRKRNEKKAYGNMEPLMEVLNIPYQLCGPFGCTGETQGFRISIETGWGNTIVETYSNRKGWQVDPPRGAYYTIKGETNTCSPQWCARIEDAQWAIANSFHPSYLDRVMKDPDYFAK